MSTAKKKRAEAPGKPLKKRRIYYTRFQPVSADHLITIKVVDKNHRCGFEPPSTYYMTRQAYDRIHEKAAADPRFRGRPEIFMQDLMLSWAAEHLEGLKLTPEEHSTLLHILERARQGD